MRESEFWANLDRAFPRRGRSLAQDLVLGELGGLSPAEALGRGVPARRVGGADGAALGRPASYRFLHRVRPDRDV